MASPFIYLCLVFSLLAIDLLTKHAINLHTCKRSKAKKTTCVLEILQNMSDYIMLIQLWTGRNSIKLNVLAANFSNVLPIIKEHLINVLIHDLNDHSLSCTSHLISLISSLISYFDFSLDISVLFSLKKLKIIYR